jgi:hypothetical protein
VPLAANLTLESYVGALKGSSRSLADGNGNWDYGVPYSSFSSRVSPSVNPLEWEELEVVLLIEPATLEDLQRKRSSSRQSECVDRELDVRVRFLSRFGLIVENMKVAIADLEKINMASDNLSLSNFRSNPVLRVIRNVLLGEKHRDFHRDRHRIVSQQETLQGFVTFLVIWCRWYRKSGCPGSVIFLPGYRWVKFGREPRGAVLGCLEKMMREMGFDARQIFL